MPSGVPKSSLGAGKGRPPAMSVYAEIFFAGFRSKQQQRSEFPRQFVHDFFAHYGTVEGFVYDAIRGVGSVKFASGEKAVDCYLAVHLSLLPPPSLPRDGHKGELLLLYLEFANACAFVDPRLAHISPATPAGDVSRHLLRHLPPSNSTARPRRACVAECIVVNWEEKEENVQEKNTKHNREGVTEVEEVEPKEKVPRMVMEGPHFPFQSEGEARDLELALWAELRPDACRSAEVGDMVSVLDLWWEFYSRYVVKKTEPDAKRIKDPYFAFAHKPSPLQEIMRLVKTQTDDPHSAKTTLDRLTHDDVYHSVCAFLCFTFRLRNDPTWASLMRDVWARAGRTVPATCNDRDGKEEEEEGNNPEAEAALLRLSTLTAAGNLIDNVRFLRMVRNRAAAEEAKAKGMREEDDDGGMNYPTSARIEDDDLYREILHTVRGFAPEGSAAGVMSMCEDPHTFRHTEGHIGWNEMHEKGKKKNNTWIMCQALLVAFFIVVIFGTISSRLMRWFGVEDAFAQRNAMQQRQGKKHPFINIRLQADL